MPRFSRRACSARHTCCAIGSTIRRGEISSPRWNRRARFLRGCAWTMRCGSTTNRSRHLIAVVRPGAPANELAVQSFARIGAPRPDPVSPNQFPVRIIRTKTQRFDEVAVGNEIVAPVRQQVATVFFANRLRLVVRSAPDVPVDLGSL